MQEIARRVGKDYRVIKDRQGIVWNIPSYRASLVDAQFAKCCSEEVHNTFATGRNDFESLLPRENINRKRCITRRETAPIRSR